MGLWGKVLMFKTKLGELVKNVVAWSEAYLTEGAFTFFPLAWFFRVGFLILFVLRSYLHPSPYSPYELTIWWVVINGFVIYLIVLGLYAWRQRLTFVSSTSQWTQVVLDTLFFSLFYFFTGDPKSDLSFALLLPLLIAARYFTISAVLSVLGAILVVMAGTLIGLNLVQALPLPNYLLGQIFLLRAFLFAGVTWSLARSEFLKRQMKNRTLEYRRRLDLLVAHGVELAQRQDIVSLIETATEAAHRELRCEVASLFLYQDGCFRRQKTIGIEDDWCHDESYAPGKGITGQVGVNKQGTHFGQPILDNQAGQNPIIIQDYLARYKTKLRTETVAHIVAIPLNGSNRTFGILRAVNKLTGRGEIDPEGFTQDDQDMLSSIGALFALAFSIAMREKKLQAVFEVNETLTNTLDEGQVCLRISEVVVEQGYRACCVLLREASDNLSVRAMCGLSATGEGQSLQSLERLQPERLQVVHTGEPNITNLQEARWPEIVNWARKQGLCSVLRLPLFQQDQVIGILEIYSGTEQDFYEDEIHTLAVFAAQATIAIVNARLSEQNQDQINKLKELAEIISSMVALDDHESLFEYVAHKAAALLNAEDCSLFWINRECNTIDLKASHSIPNYLFGQKVTPVSNQPKMGFSAYVAATGETLSFVGESYKHHPAWEGKFVEHLAHLPSKRCSSLLIYPIVDQNNSVLGVIKAENKLGVGPHEGFTQADQELLDLLATQIAMAIYKIEQIKKLRHLHQVAQTITETGEQHDVLSRIAESACEVVPADLAVICPYDVDQRELLADQAATYGQKTDARLVAKPRGGGFTQEVLQARNGYIVVEDLEREVDKHSEFVCREGVKSFIAVALKARNKPVGILFCDFRKPRHFSPEEIRNAQAFGELAAIAIHNAKLFTSLIRTVQELSAIQKLTKAALKKVELDLDSVLDVVLDTICDTLGFELCTVSLVNEAEKSIDARKGRGVPNEWVGQARHSLDSQDIQAYIIQTGQTEVIKGWDDRFDRNIYERFGHKRLIRVFTPLVGRKQIIGTVEAGFDHSRKPTIAPQEVETLQRYLEQVALVIENARLLEQERLHEVQLRRLHEMSQQMGRAISQEEISSILQLAADMATMVTGPGASAAIYFYDRQYDHPRLQLSSGAKEELLHAHSAFAYREHAKVISSGRLLIRQGQYPPPDGPPSVCVPLRAGGEVLGTLCVVYDRDHWFTSNELKNLDLCAAQVAIVITNARAHQQLTSSLDGLSDEIGRSYHWVGEPLAYVMHVMENLLANKLGPLTAKQVDRLNKAMQELNGLRQRIERLLLMRPLEEGSLQLRKVKINVGALIGDAILKVRPLAIKGHIKISRNIKEITGTIELDKEKIEDVLINLLGNAVKFTPPGGKIDIWGYERDHEIVLSICDNGIGIAPEHLERVFDKYFQAISSPNKARTGFGLGLYFARKFVEMHGGSITVESQLGKGSSFSVILPK